jgi:acyl-ACP thioesterase
MRIYIITIRTHFSAIIISDEAVGVDIELQRKNMRIANKFCESEFQFLNHGRRRIH